jgi:uncharacterized surface protein with fasciclin (FAS1) repeats
MVNTMKNIFKIATLVVALARTSALATGVTVVGGEDMFPSKDIIDNAVKSKDHTTLVAAVKAAGLVDTLKGSGPFTVFAPTNEAFSALPPGTVENLLKPEAKETLTKVLGYHVISGKLEFSDLVRAIKKAGGKTRLKTLEGETLIAMMNGEHNIVLKDAKGDIANISTYDVVQSNGVIHVIDKVLLP